MLTTEYGSTDRFRDAWELHANLALERAGRPERIDRRSLEAQGVEREPGIHVGPNAKTIDARGQRPASSPKDVTRISGGKPRKITLDYPKIDRGKTRIEENEERRRRNAGRSLPSEGSREWTDRGGMVAQQRSALEWYEDSMAPDKKRQAKAHGESGLPFYRDDDPDRSLDR